MPRPHYSGSQGGECEDGSCGMWHHVVTLKLTDVSEMRTASIIRSIIAIMIIMKITRFVKQPIISSHRRSAKGTVADGSVGRLSYVLYY
jgi:hypothetical protein